MVVDPIHAARVPLIEPTVILIDPPRSIAEVLAAVVKAVPILFWNLTVVVDLRPLWMLEAVKAFHGPFVVDFDRRYHVDVVLLLRDAPRVLFEKREIPNIAERIVVLPRPVPDVKLDIGKSVPWVGAKAVLVLIKSPRSSVTRRW